jgi:hypothetical protein
VDEALMVAVFSNFFTITGSPSVLANMVLPDMTEMPA